MMIIYGIDGTCVTIPMNEEQENRRQCGWLILYWGKWKHQALTLSYK